jgi:hypothetical protein
LLAEAIPALSLPVGANRVTNFGTEGINQFNMPAQFADPNNWPRSPVGGVAPWHHSDMHDVAYPFIYKFYNQLVNTYNQ